jgi:hypothetical protein
MLCGILATKHKKLSLVTPYINQKITLICCDAICGHVWKRMQTSRRKLGLTHFTSAAGHSTGTPEINSTQGSQPGQDGKGCRNTELLATTFK